MADEAQKEFYFQLERLQSVRDSGDQDLELRLTQQQLKADSLQKSLQEELDRLILEKEKSEKQLNYLIEDQGNTIEDLKQ